MSSLGGGRTTEGARWRRGRGVVCGLAEITFKIEHRRSRRTLQFLVHFAATSGGGSAADISTSSRQGGEALARWAYHVYTYISMCACVCVWGGGMLQDLCAMCFYSGISWRCWRRRGNMLKFPNAIFHMHKCSFDNTHTTMYVCMYIHICMYVSQIRMKSLCVPTYMYVCL